MKKTYLLVLTAFFSLSCFAQDLTAQEPTGAIDKRIVEVYAGQLAELMKVPQRLKDLNNILFKRTEIITLPYVSGEKYTKLSQMPLFNKYNPALERDKTYDPATFNVLKYNLQFYHKHKKIYRIDNTDLVIIIKPQYQK
jgi:hypothetical protein